MRGIFDLHRQGKTVRAIAACGLLTITLSAALAEEGGSSDHQWTMGGQNLRNWRNQDNTGINPHTVANLKTKWIFTTGNDVTATPAVANGVVYFPDFAGNFYAVNAKTGALVWTRKVSDWTGIAGDYARNDPLVYGDRVILGDQAGRFALWNGSQLTGAGARVMAVDAHTGNPIWVTRVETFPGALVTSSPVVFDGIVYVGIASAEEEQLAVVQGYPCCVSRGSLVALDVKTGQMLWKTYMVPNNMAFWVDTAAAAFGTRRPSSIPSGIRFMSAPETIIRFRTLLKPATKRPRRTRIAPIRLTISIRWWRST